MHERGKAFTTAIPAGHHALVLVQPGEQAFDLPPPAIAPERPASLCRRARAVAPMRRNQLDALGRESLIERITVVGTIPDKSSGSSHGVGRSEGSLDKGDLMWASSSRVHGEWKTMRVCHNHELRTCAPLGLAHLGAPLFATTKVPSMKHSASSICPRSSRSRASASRILRMPPAVTQRLNRRKQVEAEGKRSGKSAHAAPVRKTQRTPLSTARSSCLSGRPRPSARPFCAGSKGANSAHCSSVSSSRRARPRS
jgi:hypothetical protein